MLKFVPFEDVKRGWALFDINPDEDKETLVHKFEFISSTLPTKFEVVADTLDDMQVFLPEFGPFYRDLIKTYVEKKCDGQLVKESIPQLVDFCKQYVELKGIDYGAFYNARKATKDSVEFKENDIKQIIQCSTTLKFFSIFQYDMEMKLSENLSRTLFETIVHSCVSNTVIENIFKLVKVKVYRSKTTDKDMWNLIKATVTETAEQYIMNIFNFIMTNIFSTLDVTKNPISLFVGVIDESIGWMMKSVYKNSTIYGETYSTSDGIYGSSISKESWQIYCCNDTIGKAAAVGLDLIEQDHAIDSIHYDEIKERTEKINYVHPVMKLVTLPIASKVLDISYKQLITSPPKHNALIGVLLYETMSDFLKPNYPIVHELLLCHPKDRNYQPVRSSYKIKKLDYLFENSNVFGFASKHLKYQIVSCLCGIISASKRNLVSIVTGEPMRKITFTDIEEDIVKFFCDLYSDNIDFTDAKRKIDAYF